MSVPSTVGRPVYRLYQLAWAGLDWLYPPQCGGCGSSCSRWCLNCQENTRLIPNSICRLCGRVLTSTGLCSICQDSPPPFTALRSWAVFNGPIRNALHRLKYYRDIALGETLARPMIDMLKELEWDVDLITAVPLGVARQKERGYNQAALLALPLALGSGRAYHPWALMKVRETRSQVGLTSIQRRENVVKAFRAQRSIVSDQRILVVDDVTTSGATLEACASTLLQEGARQVYCLTLARTVLEAE